MVGIEEAELLSAMHWVERTPPAAEKRWLRPSRSARRERPTSPRVMATTVGPSTPPVSPCKNFRESDQREAGPKAEDQNTQGDGHHTGRDQQSFRSHGIHKRAARHLT